MQAHTTCAKGSGRGGPQLGIEGSRRKQSERLRPSSSRQRRHDRPHARAYVARAVLLSLLRASLLLGCLPLLPLLLDFVVIIVAIKPRPRERLTHCHGVAVHRGSGASRLGIGIGFGFWFGFGLACGCGCGCGCNVGCGCGCGCGCGLGLGLKGRGTCSVRVRLRVRGRVRVRVSVSVITLCFATIAAERPAKVGRVLVRFCFLASCSAGSLASFLARALFLAAWQPALVSRQ